MLPLNTTTTYTHDIAPESKMRSMLFTEQKCCAEAGVANCLYVQQQLAYVPAQLQANLHQNFQQRQDRFNALR